MKLKINDKDYTLKYNLLARIKLSKKFVTEQKMLELIQEQDFDSLILFIRYCIQENMKDSYFLEAYPRLQETKEAFFSLAIELIKLSVNPFDFSSKESIEEKYEELEIDYKELILNIMAKGYTQIEALNMTNWDINLLFQSDYKKLERETIHTNAIINTMLGLMGVKEKFDLLNRQDKLENLQEKYSLEFGALDLLNKAKEKGE